MTSSVPESSVLAPRNPALTNTDDWPEFRLADAVATLPGPRDREPVSLLLASEHYPLTVTGRLPPPRDGEEHLWRRKDGGGKEGTPIVLDDVRSFAYGSYEDGSVEIWAAGKAGWFVIQPGRGYRKIYEDMCAAVQMLFFVVDAYTEPVPKKKRKKGSHESQPWAEPSPEQLFEMYAREELGDEKRSAEAVQAVYTHRDFLLSSMLAGKEGMAWSRNSLYRHLGKKFANDLRTIRERSAPPAKAVSKAATHARQGSEDTASSSSSLKRKRGRPPKNKPVDVISIGSSSAASSTRQGLPQRSAPSRLETQTTGVAARPANTRRTRNNSQLIPANSATPEIQESATPVQNNGSDDDGEDGDEGDEDDDVPARAAANGKSALRPKASKPMKGPAKGPKSGKAPLRDDDELDIRSSPIPGKRRRDEPANDSQAQAGARRSKRRNNRQEAEEDEGIDIPTSPSSNSVPDQDSDAEAGAPNHPSLADSLAHHKPDPIQENTWLCALDGCTHKIYGDPSDPTSQRLIREHYALHAYDDDERVQMVKKLAAPSLPTNHLMERVKVAANREGFPGSKVAGTRFLEPLRTRF